MRQRRRLAGQSRSVANRLRSLDDDGARLVGNGWYPWLSGTVGGLPVLVTDDGGQWRVRGAGTPHETVDRERRPAGVVLVRLPEHPVAADLGALDGVHDASVVIDGVQVTVIERITWPRSWSHAATRSGRREVSRMLEEAERCVRRGRQLLDRSDERRQQPW